MVFGKVKVLSFAHIKNRNAYWNIVCECGVKKLAKGISLRQGDIKSCGCRINSITHGMTKKPIFNVWSMMKQRCTNKNHKYYPLYGGRGISFCDRWAVFENFLEDMGQAPEGMELDRIDNNLGYSKENCKWSTRKEQMRNTRTNSIVILDGRSMTVMEASEITGLHFTLLYQRTSKRKIPLTQETGLFLPAWVKPVLDNP